MMSAMHHPPPRIPVDYDAVGAGKGNTSSTFSWSHTIGGNAVIAGLNIFGNEGYPNNNFSAYNQTSRFNSLYNYNGFMIGDAPGAGLVTFSANTAVSDPWAGVVIPLIP